MLQKYVYFLLNRDANNKISVRVCLYPNHTKTCRTLSAKFSVADFGINVTFTEIPPATFETISSYE